MNPFIESCLASCGFTVYIYGSMGQQDNNVIFIYEKMEKELFICWIHIYLYSCHTITHITECFCRRVRYPLNVIISS